MFLYLYIQYSNTINIDHQNMLNATKLTQCKFINDLKINHMGMLTIAKIFQCNRTDCY